MGMPMPTLTRRAESLGWLASTPEGYPLRFAAVGETEEEARSNFAQAVTRWEAIPDES